MADQDIGGDSTGGMGGANGFGGGTGPGVSGLDPTGLDSAGIGATPTSGMTMLGPFTYSQSLHVQDQIAKTLGNLGLTGLALGFPALAAPLAIARGAYGLATNPGQTAGGYLGGFLGNAFGGPFAGLIGAQLGAFAGRQGQAALAGLGPFTGTSPTPTGSLSAPVTGVGGSPIVSSNYDRSGQGTSLVNPYYG